MNPCTPTSGVQDAHKRVRYHQGMVLGVEDFDQQQAWIDGRLRWTARDALGYGVLRGLGLELQGTGADVEVKILPGSAIDVCGRLVCVPQAQCARVADWFLHNTYPDAKVEGGDQARLYVSLCYTTCDTDPILAPGDPCRTDEETWVASRIADHFELKLTPDKPKTEEEAAIRRLGRLFESVQIVGAGGSNEELWLEAVQKAADGPDDVGPIDLDEDDAAERMHQALQWFATERRRSYVTSSDSSGCADLGAFTCCIPLGAVRARVQSQSVNGVTRWVLRTGSGSAPTIEDGSRITLASVRLLQELTVARFGRRDGLIVAGRFDLSVEDLETLFDSEKPVDLGAPTVGMGAVIELIGCDSTGLYVGISKLARASADLLATITPHVGWLSMAVVPEVFPLAELGDEDTGLPALEHWRTTLDADGRAHALLVRLAFVTRASVEWTGQQPRLPTATRVIPPEEKLPKGFEIQLTSLGR